jgi:hypothetical protein
MRIRQHARHEVGVRIGRELVVLALHATDHRAHDVAQQRGHMLDFLVERRRRHDRELAERQRLRGVRARLCPEQRRFAEKVAAPERADDDAFVLAPRRQLDLAVRDQKDDGLAGEALRVDDLAGRGRTRPRLLTVQVGSPAALIVADCASHVGGMRSTVFPVPV